jgi:hypothetical protein
MRHISKNSILSKRCFFLSLTTFIFFCNTNCSNSTTEITDTVTAELSEVQISYPGDDPGEANFKKLSNNSVVLENNVIKMKFFNDGKGITIEGFEDKKAHERLKMGNAALFELTFADNSVITSNEFTLLNPPVTSNIIPNLHAVTYADRLAGKKYEADFENQKLGLRLHWEADLRDDANYVRQIFTFAAKDTANISKITLVKLPVNIGVVKGGAVDGSPMVHKNMFFAIEHPMGQVEQSKASLVAYLLQLTPVTSDKNLTISTVWGTTPIGQLRRGFLYYIERERSNPYRQMLHYNSWYDISWADRKFNENQALDRVKMFRDSLIIKRQVQLNAFLFDDGWDDNKTLWQFNNTGFPNGFTRLAEVAEACGSSIGVWLSPFGGYNTAKVQRIEFGKNQVPPFETNANGFSLAGPIYYHRFLDVTKNFIQDYNISMFKFDGVGPGNDADGAGINYHNDIEAFLKLCKDLKQIKPTLYIDLTTGTWASPYWLMYGDNIWRSGGDYGLGGEGSKRQQGITYRDGHTYRNVVKAGPLYPLNALMNGGIIIAEFGLPYKFANDDKDISDDIWSFFGTGVSLQELYINPHYLNTVNWNCLAKASNWAKENERIMPDVHWVGGDPIKSEVYGYAAWSPQRAILMLRNPSNETKSFQVNVANVFELPVNIKNDYRFYDAKTGSKEILAQGQSFTIILQPFEVKVLNALPK